MGEKMTPCAECGMPCEPGEYHPYAACLMFKGCHNSTTVRANLTQPAQAVYVEEIRTVAGMLDGYCEASEDCCYGTLSTSLVRDLTKRITAALPNANGKEGCQHDWKQVTTSGGVMDRCSACGKHKWHDGRGSQ